MISSSLHSGAGFISCSPVMFLLLWLLHQSNHRNRALRGCDVIAKAVVPSAGGAVAQPPRGARLRARLLSVSLQRIL